MEWAIALIYLDNNATSLMDPMVVERMQELMRMRLASTHLVDKPDRLLNELVKPY